MFQGEPLPLGDLLQERLRVVAAYPGDPGAAEGDVGLVDIRERGSTWSERKRSREANPTVGCGDRGGNRLLARLRVVRPLLALDAGDVVAQFLDLLEDRLVVGAGLVVNDDIEASLPEQLLTLPDELLVLER